VDLCDVTKLKKYFKFAGLIDFCGS